MVLVDTCVWSLALRRRQDRLRAKDRAVRDELARLIDEDQVLLIGPIRQEILSGIRDLTAFEELRSRLRGFDDVALVASDYEEAARCCNVCASNGIAAASIDCLICAVALRHRIEVFTTDRDFVRFARVLPLRLHEVA